MLEGLAVTGSTPSFSIGLSLSSVLTSDLSHFLFFSQMDNLNCLFRSVPRFVPFFFFSSSHPLFPHLKVALSSIVSCLFADTGAVVAALWSAIYHMIQ